MCNRWKCDERRLEAWVEKPNETGQDRENCVTCYARELELHVEPADQSVNDKEMVREVQDVCL